MPKNGILLISAISPTESVMLVSLLNENNISAFTRKSSGNDIMGFAGLQLEDIFVEEPDLQTARELIAGFLNAPVDSDNFKIHEEPTQPDKFCEHNISFFTRIFLFLVIYTFCCLFLNAIFG
ncbi:MAG: hypothetical protein VB082_06420 [Christensenella sp.]|nr:hypothetical protein [Christensenella sp.]